MKKILVLFCFNWIFYSSLSSQEIISPKISTNGIINVIVSDSNNIYIGGNFSEVGRKAVNIVKLSLQSNTSELYPSLGGDRSYANIIISDGNLGWYVGGSFNIEGITNLVHILGDQTIDRSFKPNPNGEVRALYQEGNLLYVGGSFTQLGGQARSRIGVINTNSGDITEWNPNPNSTIHSISGFGDHIYVGGDFNVIGNRSAIGFAIINKTSGIYIPSISTNASVRGITQDSSNIYINGFFTGAQGLRTGSIALMGTTSDKPDFNFPIIDGTIIKIISDGNGGWYVGGSFNKEGITNLAHIQSDQTIDRSFTPNPNGEVRALYQDGDLLYVGGTFSQIGGQSRSRIGVINITSGDITEWNPNPNNAIHSISGFGDHIYVGGDFNMIGNRSAIGFAIINKTSGIYSPSISTNASVRGITQDSSNIYINGNFTGSQGLRTGSIALMGTASDKPDFNFPVIDGTILKIISDGNGGWYVGGSFNIEGITNLAHIQSDQTIDRSFKPNPNGEVRALFQDGDLLYVGGTFSQIGGQSRSRIGVINTTSGDITEWNPNPNSTIHSISGFGDHIYVGGDFNVIGNRSAIGFAIINKTSGIYIPSISTNASVRGITQDSSNIYINGFFTGAQGLRTGSIALMGTTSDKPDFNFPIIDGTIRKIVPDGNGGWYVGGSFNIDGIKNLAHILGDQTIDRTFTPNPNGEVITIHKERDTLYVGGTFTVISSQGRNKFGAINTKTGDLTDLDFESSLNNITAITSLDLKDDTLVIAYNVPQGAGTKNIIALKLSNNKKIWQLNYGSSHTSINVLKIYKSRLLIGEVPYGNTKTLTCVNLLDGSVTGINFNSAGRINCIEVKGDTAYIGGSFSSIGGQVRNNIAEINLITGKATTWNPNANGAVHSIQIVGDNLYVGGAFTKIGGQDRNYLASINLLTAKSNDWNPKLNAATYSVSNYGNQVLVGGVFSRVQVENKNYFMAISKTSGQITNLDINSNSNIYHVEINGNKAYVGGSFSAIGGQPRNHLAEINLTSGNATNWNPNANGTVHSTQRVGDILFVAGEFTKIGGQDRNYIASVDILSGKSNEWNPKVNAASFSVGNNSNQILVGGGFSRVQAENRNYFMAISKTSALITNLDIKSNGYVANVEINKDKAFVGGSYSSIGGQPRNSLAEINLSTGNATTWNPNANGTVHTTRLVGNTIYAGGEFTKIGGQDRNYLAAIDVLSAKSNEWNPNLNYHTYTVTNNGSKLLIGGVFSRVHAENRNYFMAISKTSGRITNLDIKSSSLVYSVELNRDKAFIGGNFGSVGGQSRNNLAEINLNSGNATTWNPNVNGTVHAIRLIGDNLFIGGEFTKVGDQDRNYLASLNVISAKLNEWNPNPNLPVYGINVIKNQLYAAGSFTLINSAKRNNLLSVKKNTEVLNSWNPNPNGVVNTLMVYPDKIFVGGSFSSIGGQPRNNISQIDKIIGNASIWNPNINGSVKSIANSGNLIYVGGGFSKVGDFTSNNLAAINLNTGIAINWNPNLNNSVNKIVVSDSSIYVIGSFTRASNQDRNYLAQFKLSDNKLTAWNPNIKGTRVDALAITGSSIYIGGSFYEVFNQQRSNIASIYKNGGIRNWKPVINGNVSAISAYGKNVYVAGNFSQAGGQTSNGFATFNANTGIPNLSFPVITGGINTIFPLESTLYLGGSISRINQTSVGGLAYLKYDTKIFSSEIDDFNPKSAGNTGLISFELFGNGFSEGTSVLLKRLGNPDILLSDVVIHDDIRISGNFDLRGLQEGAWDLHVQIPNDTTIIVKNGFLVEKGSRTKLWSNIVGFDRIRLGQWQTFNIFYGNEGNIDAHGVPFYFAVSDNAEVELDFQLSEIEKEYFASLETKEFNRDSIIKLMAEPIILDSFFDIKTRVKVYSLYFHTIPINSVNSLSFRVRLKSAGSFKMQTWFSGAYFGSAIKPFTKECFWEILTTSKTFLLLFPSTAGYGVAITVADCVLQAFNAGQALGTGGLRNDSPNVYSNIITVLKVLECTTLKLGELAKGIKLSAEVIRDLLGEITQTITQSSLDENKNRKIKDNCEPSKCIAICSCFPDDKPKVITNGLAQNPFKTNSILAGGIISDNAGCNITSHGFVWKKRTGILTLETEGANIINLGVFEKSEGTFSHTMLDLEPNETYYVRAFATNNVGTTYGTERDFHTKLDVPLVSTIGVENIKYNSAHVKGLLINKNPETTSASCGKGFLFSSFDSDPKLGTEARSVKAWSTSFSDSRGEPFSEDLSLAENTKYYVRAYSTPCTGEPVYGQVISFKTPCNPNRLSTDPPCPPKEDDGDDEDPVKDPPEPKDSVTTVASFDPNDKLGPIGIGSKNYLNTNGRLLPYIIRFENVDTATAAAQTVLILDTLDLNVFDLSTFQLGFFSIGDSIIYIPRGLKSYETDVDLRPKNDIIVRIKITLDEQSGIVKWEFNSIDPLTLLSSTLNPTAGFLPPNKETPQGEGAVMYSIKAKNSIQNGSEIKNKAYIYFDTNEPIITNEWINKSDNIQPTSRVDSVVSKFINDSTIVINWSGKDLGSGIMFYDVFANINGGNFSPLVSSTSDTSLVFSGKLNSTYSFYSIARDSANNIEGQKISPELTVTFKENDNMQNAFAKIHSFDSLVCFNDSSHVYVKGSKDDILHYKISNEPSERTLVLNGQIQKIPLFGIKSNTVFSLIKIQDIKNKNEIFLKDSVQLKIISTAKPIITMMDSTLCVGDSVIFKVKSGNSGLPKFKWIIDKKVDQIDSVWNGSFNMPGSFMGRVLSIYNDKCTDSITYSINISNPPSLAELNAKDNQVFCVNDTLKMIGDGLKYQWYRNNRLMPGDTLSFLILKRDTAEFQGEIIGMGGCSLKTGLVSLSVKSGIIKPKLRLDGNVLTNIDTLKGYIKYTWYTGNTLIKDSLRQSLFLSTYGKYHLRAQDSLGCWNESEVFDYSAKWFDSLVCSGVKIKPETGRQGVEYKGSVDLPYLKGNGELISFDTLKSKGITGMIIYLLDKELKNGNGSLKFNLTGTALQAGTVSFNIELGGKSCIVSLPIEGLSEQIATMKVFTPNGDGINDFWGIPELMDRPEVGIIIFDREGIKIHEMSATEGWDGRDNGLALPSGDYWFIIKYPTSEGKENQLGHFTLLR